MKRMNLGAMEMILLTIFILTLPEKVHAIPGLGNIGAGYPTPQINHVLRVPPRPPGWPQMWIAADVIKSFNENGLTVEKIINKREIELSRLPTKTNVAIKFSVLFNERKLKGCILEFDKKRDFEKVLNHYLDLNEAGKLHTWSLVKDNILVVIEGAMPKKEIQEYKAVLAGME